MSTVKGGRSPKPGAVAERLATLLALFSPWEGISLTYRQLAAELGTPITEAAVKKWPQRQHLPADAARLIVTKARERGLGDVTLEWLLWGDGQGPHKGQRGSSKRQRALPTASQEPHGHFAEEIGEALQADLSHNEFGQWSSVEVQRTVLWALKDLARRLRVLQFDMGRTFELADRWAESIGLPVRAPRRPPDQGA